MNICQFGNEMEGLYNDKHFISLFHQQFDFQNQETVIKFALYVVIGIIVFACMIGFFNRKKKKDNVDENKKEEPKLPLDKRALPYINETKKNQNRNR